MQNKSDVEKLYEQMQAKLGGNIPWNQLPPMLQHQFVAAVNEIIQTCSYRYVE